MGINIFHRGWTETHEEESVAAIKEAIGKGGVEFDLRPTSDDYIVIHHDSTWDRLTQYTGRIIDTDFATANAYKTLRGYDVPSLKNAVESTKGQTTFLDCKLGNGWTDAAIDRVGITLTEVNAFRHTYAFFYEWSLLDRFKARVPNLNVLYRPDPAGPNTNYGVPSTLNHNAAGVLASLDSLWDGRIDNFHDAGLYVFGQTYSLSDETEYWKYMNQGIDGIIIEWDEYESYNHIC